MKRCIVESIRVTAAAAAIFGTVNLSAADGVPPMLFFVTPSDGTEEVIPQTTVIFFFSEPMAPNQSIAWSSNLDASRFNYTWMSDGIMLMAAYQPGLPANETITWTLNPTPGQANNFRAADGDELPSGIYQGSFTVAAGGGPVDPNDPCGPGVDDGMGFGSVAKQANFVQVGNNDPVLDIEQETMMAATYRGASNQTVTAVSVSGPASLTLTNLFGSFNAFRQYDSISALESAFPPGNYTINATGAGSATIALGNLTTVPVPKINNLPALAGMDVTKDFTLNFAPFTGGGVNEFISISISGGAGAGEFHAPDPCIPRELPVNATSVVIPANTFKVGETYSGSISFVRLMFNSNSIPNTGISATVGNTTSFEFTIGGGAEPNAPMWTTITRNPDGTITYTITGDTGLNIAIEASETLSGDWAQVATAALTTGSFQFTASASTPNKRFYRARVM